MNSPYPLSQIDMFLRGATIELRFTRRVNLYRFDVTWHTLTLDQGYGVYVQLSNKFGQAKTRRILSEKQTKQLTDTVCHTWTIS